MRDVPGDEPRDVTGAHGRIGPVVRRLSGRRRIWLSLAALLLVIVTYPSALSWVGQGVPWRWAFASPQAGRTHAAAMANVFSMQGIIDKHPSEWGGLYVEGDGIVVLTVTRSTDVARRYLAGLGIKDAVTIHKAARSVWALDALQQRVRANLRDGWGPVVSFGPQYSLNVIVVEMQWPDPFMLKRLHDVAPDGVIALWRPGPTPQAV